MPARMLAPAAFAACLVASVAAAQSADNAHRDAAIVMPSETAGFHYLNPGDFLPQRVLPLPPARGSAEEANELATLRRMIAQAPPERIAKAAADGETEDPSLYDEVLGVDLKTLPATWNLLVAVQDEDEAAIVIAKDAFDRTRPYGIDRDLPTCTKVNRDKPAHSYPSGHAGVGWSVGWTLAHLLPELAPAILARADQYALSRLYCGVHFPSDVEASHALASVIADRLLADPRLAGRIAAARAELVAARPDLVRP